MAGQARNRSVINTIDRLINWIAGGLVGLGVLLMTYQVILRAVFSRTHDWGLEVLEGVVIAGLMLAGASLVRTDGHTRVSSITGKLHGKTLFAWELALQVLSTATFTALFISAVIYVYHVMGSRAVSSSSLATPQWIYYLPLPVSMGGCALFFLEKIVLQVHSLWRKQ